MLTRGAAAVKPAKRALTTVAHTVAGRTVDELAAGQRRAVGVIGTANESPVLPSSKSGV
jgi:hypothetical protein